MACCGDKLDETTKNIDNRIKNDLRTLQTTVKILLLGAGQTGKTTFLKQIQHLYAEGFDEDKLRLYRRVIIGNITDLAELMIEEMAGTGGYQEEVISLKQVLDTADRGGDYFDPKLADALMKFWKKPSVQSFFRDSDKWLKNDSWKHFFDKLGTITKPNYQPTAEDIFRCRTKTTGIYELKFTIIDKAKRKYTYVLTDVGGQRSERNKWIHCFEGVMAVIFFVDLNGFNLTLDEAPTFNRLQESLKLFEAICNSQWFKTTNMILFFNKVDLFKEKLEHVKFADHVPGYYGDNSFDSTTTFLKQKFISLNNLNPNKPIYVHFTCATDTKNMKFVFNTVSESIIRNSLQSSGLL